MWWVKRQMVMLLHVNTFEMSWLHLKWGMRAEGLGFLFVCLFYVLWCFNLLTIVTKLSNLRNKLPLAGKLCILLGSLNAHDVLVKLPGCPQVPAVFLSLVFLLQLSSSRLQPRLLENAFCYISRAISRLPPPPPWRISYGPVLGDCTRHKILLCLVMLLSFISPTPGLYPAIGTQKMSLSWPRMQPLASKHFIPTVDSCNSSRNCSSPSFGVSGSGQTGMMAHG